MTKKVIAALVFVSVVFPATVYSQDAQALVEAAVSYYRGEASIATVAMIIHRPQWERRMTLKAWTKGQKNSIFTVLAPPKDHGNGTLKKAQQMWTYNPKINRIIKLPPSMMSQAWMGSDFSNNDLAKSDSILEDYTHTFLRTETHDGKRVFVIKSMPKPKVPVVWGMQTLKIREDHILLCEEYYDEEMKLVKAMTGRQIQMLGGKLFPKLWKMEKADAEDEYTLLDYKGLEFKEDLPDFLFTLSTLRKLGR